MNRVEFLKNKWQEKVGATASDHDHSMPAGTCAFDFLLGADPSGKGLYTEFVMRAYANGQFLAEDIDRVRETLCLFHANKRRLPADRRDIGGYGSERELWSVLDEAGVIEKDTVSGKGAKRSDRSRAHLESEVTESDGWKMVELKSAFAGAWWGLGTRWCTTSGPMFNNYATRGPLRVFVSPDGVKHQLHIATSSLCDATDARVRMADFFATLPKAFADAIRSDVARVWNAFNRPSDTLSIEEQFRHYLRGTPDVPRDFLPDDVFDIAERFRIAGLERLSSGEAEEGWLLKHGNNQLSSWALHHMLGIPFERGHEHLMVIADPEGNELITDFSGPSLHAIRETVIAMPPRLREQVLRQAISVFHRDRAAGVGIDAIVSSIPYGELSNAFWEHWAKKVGAYDVDCRNKATPEERFATFPNEVFTEKLALVFAKRGNKDRIPCVKLENSTVRMTRGVARTLAKANADCRCDPDLVSLFTMEDFAEVYGGNNGKHLDTLPEKLRTLAMLREITRLRRGSLPRIVELIRFGFFDLEGLPVETVVREMVDIALAITPASLVDVDIPLPRSVYIEAVRRDSGMLSWVPLEFRDVEMCTASFAHNNHGLCHFPEWVVNAIREANDGKHGITGNYKASLKYPATLNALAEPTEVPEALPPFSVKAHVAGLEAGSWGR